MHILDFGNPRAFHKYKCFLSLLREKRIDMQNVERKHILLV